MFNWLKRTACVCIWMHVIWGLCVIIVMLLSVILDANHAISPNTNKLVVNISSVDLVKLHYGYTTIRPNCKKSKYELATLNINGNFDISNDFDWNTKYIFIWLSGNYKTNTKESEVILWNTLALSKKDCIFNLNNIRNSYDFIDMDLGLNGNNISYIFKWDIHPWYGIWRRKISKSEQIFPMIIPKANKTRNRFHIKERKQSIYRKSF